MRSTFFSLAILVGAFAAVSAAPTPEGPSQLVKRGSECNSGDCGMGNHCLSEWDRNDFRILPGGCVKASICCDKWRSDQYHWHCQLPDGQNAC